MTSTTLLNLALDLIDVPADRSREFNSDGAVALAAIIAEQGLLHPIRVVRAGERYRLIAGLHRLRAFEINQQEAIPAMVLEAISEDAARLDEVMENLGRAELKALDRCHHLYDLKQVWERIHPETKKGGNKNVSNGKEKTKRQKMPFGEIKSEDMPEVFGFARATAEKIGLCQRSIRQAVMIWTRLAPMVRARLVGMALSDKQTELKALAELKPEVQAQVLDLILDKDQPKIENVAEALDYLKLRRVPDRYERLFLLYHKGLPDLPADVFNRLLEANYARVESFLKTSGRM